jgi:hypothetical protein
VFDDSTLRQERDGRRWGRSASWSLAFGRRLARDNSLPWQFGIPRKCQHALTFNDAIVEKIEQKDSSCTSIMSITGASLFPVVKSKNGAKPPSIYPRPSSNAQGIYLTNRKALEP